MSLKATQPVEAYTFTGSFKTYRYTSYERQITVDGQPHIPAPISRGAVKAGDHTQDQLDVEVTLPVTLEVVQDYAFLTSPPKLRMVLTAFDRDVSNMYVTQASPGTPGGVILWSGTVAAFSVTDRLARVRVPSNFTRALQTVVPSVFYQNPCNHVLYDSRCKVLETNFETITNVTSINNEVIEVTDDGRADNFLNAGSIQNRRTLERRLILTNIGNVITMNLPFTSVRVSDEVRLLAGCDHSFTTCRDKFSNFRNYGGHPFIPFNNPFEGRI